MKWVAQPWQLAKAPPHTIYRCLLKRVKVALPSTQKQTQGGCQIEETKKYGPYERTEQNPRKKTKQNADSQPIRCRVQNTGDQDAQELIQYGNNIEEEMKVTLSGIKKNLPGTNNGEEEAKNQTNDL